MRATSKPIPTSEQVRGGSAKRVAAPSVLAKWVVSAGAAQKFSEMAYRHGGLSIDPMRVDFFEIRLNRIAEKLGALDGDMLVDFAVRSDDVAKLLTEAMTTNTTSFFREKAHFDWLNTTGFAQLSERTLTTSEPFTLWSAACSIGAELWTAGYFWAQFAKRNALAGRPTRFVGTDLSSQVVRVACGATYRFDEVDGAPEDFLNQAMLKSKNKRDVNGKSYYRVVPELRRSTEFHVANLLDAATLPVLTADVAFLRNVLIYFKIDDQKKIVNNVVRKLRPGGILMTGHAEKIDYTDANLTQIAPAIFQKPKRREG